MSNEGKMKFYKDSGLRLDGLKILKDVIDNGTELVEIATPEGWICERCDKKGYVGYPFHTHGTYSSLAKEI